MVLHGSVRRSHATDHDYPIARPRPLGSTNELGREHLASGADCGGHSPHLRRPRGSTADTSGGHAMNYGFYLSAGGIQTAMHRMDVISNNLANVQTPAFKPDAIEVRQMLPERFEPGAMADPQWMLEQLGGGAHIDPTRYRFSQGTLANTEREMDVAIEGDGFLMVRDGQDGTDPTFLTRDGALALDGDGRLVMATTGLPVLDINSEVIRPDAGPLAISTDGTITQNDDTIAQLQIVSVADPTHLRKSGHNLLMTTALSGTATTTSTATVRQGYMENSTVDPVMAMTQLLSLSRQIKANSVLLQYQDNLTGQAMNTLGRVS
jgi:flagellar basal body rod protein FlgG